jgi:antitoxin HicB
MGKALYEVRTNLPGNRIARVLFCIADGGNDSSPRLSEEIPADTEIGSRFGAGSQAQIGGIKLKKRKHIGSSFDELLAEDGTLAAAEAAALKRVIAWQVERGMGEKRMSKADMARAMRTSRAALDRLLDPKNESVTLRTMARAASALGKRLRLELA